MSTLYSATRPVAPALADLLTRLVPGQRIRVTQTVRVGSQQWPAIVEGVFRNLRYLQTGLATERVREDEIVVPTVHFTKDNSELTSIALDEHSQVELIRS